MDITKIEVNGAEYDIKDSELTERVDYIEYLMQWGDYD